jgi:hypothetical protein
LLCIYGLWAIEEEKWELGKGRTALLVYGSIIGLLCLCIRGNTADERIFGEEINATGTTSHYDYANWRDNPPLSLYWPMAMALGLNECVNLMEEKRILK